MAAVIEHITINTGATRMSSRTEVDDAVVARLRSAIAGGTPLGAGWTYRREAHHPDGAWRFLLINAGIPVVRCWLCAKDSVSSEVWSEASEHVIDERAVLHRPRGTPWLAASLMPGALAAGQDVLMQAGDLERCIAWALLRQ